MSSQGQRHPFIGAFLLRETKEDAVRFFERGLLPSSVLTIVSVVVWSTNAVAALEEARRLVADKYKDALENGIAVMHAEVHTLDDKTLVNFREYLQEIDKDVQ